MSVILKCDRCEKEIGVVNEDKGKMYSFLTIQKKMTSNALVVGESVKKLDLCSDCQDSFDKWFAGGGCYTMTKTDFQAGVDAVYDNTDNKNKATSFMWSK